MRKVLQGVINHMRQVTVGAKHVMYIYCHKMVGVIVVDVSLEQLLLDLKHGKRD